MRPRTSLPIVACVALLVACSDRGGSSRSASNIERLVVIIQENTSFDAYFGRYCQAPNGTQPSCNDGPACCEAAPSTDPGSGIAPLLLDDAAHAAFDPPHFAACFIEEINGGRMDRYVTASCGDPRNFAYADATSVGFYRDLAGRSALADRWFQPVVGASSANDMYFARARFVFSDNTFEPDSIGAKCTLNPARMEFTDRTIGDLLADASVPWAFYIEGYQDMIDAVGQGECPPPDPRCRVSFPFYPCTYDPGDIPFQYYPRFRDNPTFMRDFSRLSTDLAAGELPAVVFVKALGFRSEHPGFATTIGDGIEFVGDVVDEILASPEADRTLILITYDESGGYFDHIAPPPTSTVDGQPYGPRLPTLAVGRFARPNYVSHVTMEHSSIVKFIEWNWLGQTTGQLGGRDLEVSNIGSLLDATETGTPVPE
jgi:phospholipase C